MDYNKATELDPEETIVYKNLGIDCRNSGDLEQAVLDFEKYLELAPNAPDREEVKKMIAEIKSEREPRKPFGRMVTDTVLLGLKNLISFAKARIKLWRQDPLFWGPVLVGAIVYVVLVFPIFARNDLLLWATQKTAAIFIIGFIWMVLWIYRYVIADVIAAAGTRMYNTALTAVQLIFPRFQLPMTNPPYRYTRFVVAIVFLIIGVLLGVWFTSGESFEEVLAWVPQEGKIIFIVFFIWLTLWLNMYFVVAAGARMYKIALAAVQQIFPRFPPPLAKPPYKDIFIVVSTVFLIIGIWLYIWGNFFEEVSPTEHTIPLYGLQMFLTGFVFFLTEGEDLLLDTHIVVLFGGVTVCAFLICIANLGPYDPCPECESWFTRKEVKSKREYVPGSYFKNAKTVRHYECSKCGANRGSSNYSNPFFDLIDPDRSIKQRFISIFWILFIIFGMSAVLWTAYHNASYDPEQALQKFDKVIKQDPDDAWAYYNRGVAKTDFGAYKQAIQDFDKAIELDPEEAMFYSYRASVCLRVENWEQAIQDSTKAIELDPHANTYYNRGVAYVNSGDLEQAIADFEQYLELAPDAPDREEVIIWIGEMKSELAP